MTEPARPLNAMRDSYLLARYAAITVALFVPLLPSFALVRNLYPFAGSTMMMAGGDSRSKPPQPLNNSPMVVH